MCVCVCMCVWGGEDGGGGGVDEEKKKLFNTLDELYFVHTSVSFSFNFSLLFMMEITSQNYSDTSWQRVSTFRRW